MAKVVVDFITAEKKCHTGEVRLVGGAPNSSSGLLEVCADGHWGRVCDYRKEWGYSENAAVVCRQLNINTTGNALTIIKGKNCKIIWAEI